MNYALIENGFVTNLIWLHPGNATDFPNAVPLGDVPAAIGDTYADGAFWRGGEHVLSLAEQIAEVQIELTEMAESVLALTDQLIALEE